jgi:hypothetical protein
MFVCQVSSLASFSALNPGKIRTAKTPLGSDDWIPTFVGMTKNKGHRCHARAGGHPEIGFSDDFYMSGTPRCGFGKQRKWQAQPALP